MSQSMYTAITFFVSRLLHGFLATVLWIPAVFWPGARPNNDISIEFEIRSKFGVL